MSSFSFVNAYLVVGGLTKTLISSGLVGHRLSRLQCVFFS